MKIDFKKPEKLPALTPEEERKLASLKIYYGDDWSIELSAVTPIIHYQQKGKNASSARTSGLISREDLALLRKDRKRRGLPDPVVEGWF